MQRAAFDTLIHAMADRKDGEDGTGLGVATRTRTRTKKPQP
ncbi:MAG: hypothetical protein JWM38_1368, partial [Sphingomonas bacterium]|nr:hypothetical protein [Sphingomonas bacterium]